MGRLPPPAEIPRAHVDSAGADPGPDAVLVSDTPSKVELALRLRLIVTPLLTGAAMLAITLALVPATRMDPDLVRLLHGMVLVKGPICLGA